MADDTMQMLGENRGWTQVFFLLVSLFTLFLTGCGGVTPPPQLPTVDLDQTRQPETSMEQNLQPAFTAYTDGISCKQVGQLMVLDKGRGNLGLMVGAFITGVNFKEQRNSSATIGQMLASINWYCRDNPKDTVTKAMVALAHDMDKGLSNKSTVQKQKKAAKSVRAITQKAVPNKIQSQKRITKAKPAAKPTLTKKTVERPKTDPGGSHVVQVMSSQDVSEAQALAKHLRSTGFPAYVTVVDLGNKGQWHRVLVGPYTDNIPAMQVAKLLGKLNYNVFVRLR
jgi:cell division septation protein DedD